MVFAPFGILCFSWKTALERRCSLSCWGMELRGSGLGCPRDGNVDELGLSSRHTMSVWGRQRWWGWDPSKMKFAAVGTEGPSHWHLGSRESPSVKQVLGEAWGVVGNRLKFLGDVGAGVGDAGRVRG